MNKYQINDSVYIYEKGKLVQKTIKYINILISGIKTEVGYQFHGDDIRFIHGLFKDESEVFQTKDEFIKANN